MATNLNLNLQRRQQQQQDDLYYYLHTKFCFFCSQEIEYELNTITEKRYPINKDDRNYHVCAAKQAVRELYKLEWENGRNQQSSTNLENGSQSETTNTNTAVSNTVTIKQEDGSTN